MIAQVIKLFWKTNSFKKIILWFLFSFKFMKEPRKEDYTILIQSMSILEFYGIINKLFTKLHNMTDPKIFDADVQENKTLAAFSYLYILCLIPLLLKRDSKFVQFHAKQGLVLFAGEVILHFVFWIPIIGWILFLMTIIIAAVGCLKAYNGEWWKGPFIYKWSQKIKF